MQTEYQSIGKMLYCHNLKAESSHYVGLYLWWSSGIEKSYTLL